MEKIKIGHDAGKIWQLIDENKQMKISDLKTTSKMDIKDLYLALGWLARENKVYFSEEDRELAIGIIY